MHSEDPLKPLSFTKELSSVARVEKGDVMPVAFDSLYVAIDILRKKGGEKERRVRKRSKRIKEG